MRDFIEVKHITDSEKEFVSDKNQKKDWKNYNKKKISSDYGLSSYLSQDSQAAMLFWVQSICHLAINTIGNIIRNVIKM